MGRKGKQWRAIKSIKILLGERIIEIELNEGERIKNEKDLLQISNQSNKLHMKPKIKRNKKSINIEKIQEISEIQEIQKIQENTDNSIQQDNDNENIIFDNEFSFIDDTNFDIEKEGSTSFDFNNDLYFDTSNISNEYDFDCDCDFEFEFSF
ncbi:hypothetical protein M9Y10_000421 [Tritrichomonas musculus]|uniref:Uncharacterized protein n=1 Tax=Tritrichomonas musculus TaxID=1915356 RepID=A0ABR2L466_9EUKA